MKNSQAVKTAIDNVIAEGITDIFDRPFEVDLLSDPDFRNALHHSVLEGLNKVDSKVIKDSSQYHTLVEELAVHPINFVLMPKKEAYDFRRCALIHPVDTIKYLALTIPIGKAVERFRIQPSKNIVFSYRFKLKDSMIFDSKYNFTSFRNHERKRAKSLRVKVVVRCDIANFYDRLNIHRLESILLSLPIDKKRVKLVNELLLFWANRDSYGLPIGSNASRILAECALIEVDKYLLSNGVHYCRFVDDFRMFAKDGKQAQFWLSLLIDRLSYEGLTINHNKTEILLSSEV